MASFLEELERIRRYSPHTTRSYRVDLELFAQHCGQRNITTVTDAAQVTMIMDYLSARRRHGDSQRTLARRTSSLRSFFRAVARQGHLEGDVADLFPSLKISKTLPRFLSEDVMTRWLDALPNATIWDARDRALVLVFYATGARLAEIAGLTWEAVDENNERLRVLGKGNKYRLIPLGSAATQGLLTYREKVADEFGADQTGPTTAVFINPKGNRLTTRSLARILARRFAAIASGGKVHPHMIRHTFATHLINRGADLMAIKEILGHQSVETTQVYTHVSNAYLKKTYKQAFPRAERAE